MAQKKYVSLSKLSTFLDKLKTTFSAIGHGHTLSDITDYTVDTEFSDTSTNPVQNKVLNDEFEAVATAMNVLDNKLEELAITPQEYGAKGDGTTDDTSAFLTALAENRRVYVPSGTYVLSEELTLGQNCQLKLSQDTVLDFKQTSGNCISMKASSNIVGNHAVIKVPYEFTGRVINIYAGLDDSIVGVPPFTAWGPMWTAARYITDLHIVKLDHRGVAQSVDGTCSGTAVYLGASTNDSMNFLWAVDLTRLRISGAFSYGIHMDTVSSGLSGWIHQTRISGFVDGAEIGIYAKDTDASYLSVLVIPRRALTTDGTYVPYAKWGIYLDNCTNVDLSGSRVMDWNNVYSLWSEGSVNQHLALIGDCSGAILSEHYYYDSENYDIRSLIYTDTPSNLERLTILQEPFTRWFKPVDGEPWFNNGDTEERLLLKDEFDNCFQTDNVANFTNAISTAINTDGTVFEGTGYVVYGKRWDMGSGTLLTDQRYNGCTGLIPVAAGDTIYVESIALTESNGYTGVVLFDADFKRVVSGDASQLINNSISYYFSYTAADNGFTITVKKPANTAYVAINYERSKIGSYPVVSINEPITYSQEGFLTDSIKVKAENVYGLDEAVVGKADASHNHDDRYYTEIEIDELVATLNSSISSKSDITHNHDSAYDSIGAAENALATAKTYTDTKTSSLASASSVSTSISTHNTSTSAHSDIRTLISDLSNKLNNFLDVDDTTTDQLSEVLTLINNNKGTLESLTTSKINVSDIVNNLTTNSTDKVLSAAQGVVIKGLIDALDAIMPTVTSSDAGKFLRVSSVGTWAAETVQSAEEVSF